MHIVRHSDILELILEAAVIRHHAVFLIVRFSHSTLIQHEAPFLTVVSITSEFTE
jgi:hypothetical protein